MREVVVEQLAQASEEELWLSADSSDLRKPYAEAMPYLMHVRNLDEQLVPGYRTRRIGLTPGRRGLLYHQLLRSQAPEMSREPAAVQKALQTVSKALAALKEQKSVTGLLDSGFDDIAVVGKCGARSGNSRSISSRASIIASARSRSKIGTGSGAKEGDIAQARANLRPLAQVETSMEVKHGKQVRPKRQSVKVNLSACPLRVTYQTNVRRKGQGRQVTHEIWVVEVRVLGTDWEPWLLVTDWPITDAQSAKRIFTMYRQSALCEG